MDPTKLINSISTIHNDNSKLYSSVHHTSSLQSISLPFKETLPLKLPKRPFRKQTTATMLSETLQDSQRSCLRNYEQANRSRIFENPEQSRRVANPGIFHSLSRQSITYTALNRSFEDMGVANNRKKHHPSYHNRPDPITIGERSNQHNSALQKVWGEPRRHRDNGKNCLQTMAWNPKKTAKSYLQMHRDTKQSSGRGNRFSILS